MSNPWIVFGVLLAFAVVVVSIYIMWPQECPAELHVLPDGTIRIVSTGKSFASMHAFQQWWTSSEFKDRCPIPLQSGKGGRIVETHEIPPEKEQTFTTMPIMKVDDYDDYNRVLFDRTHDWVNKPYSSEERKQIAARISTVEGFDGVPKQVMDSVLRAYGPDTEYEPVITQTGENHWEVHELTPKRSSGAAPMQENDVHTDQIGVTDAHVSFQYRTKEDVQSALDPYFGSDSGRYGPDPFAGPVPGMERMFGPTFDTTRWV
jgi:hypothetical protein